ncbi:endopeptidase La [Rickettsiales endosymbiont of Stachyamoeba lipophora]|uniref:endopeptidase La n=1 Tax=Rickettsiales endosymbiont of Stachyamoeba lipophora TaxID=2486578 RepID=UPI000F652344|nr:endopeptidase La [Rickettsiales endosymbiont of Stachyamoeba lipophora]AZL15069.1 endopeptidase La [Rickettsiales endosymbiont of Stachyamoeba lipophora]
MAEELHLTEGEDKKQNNLLPENLYPVVPVRDIVVFPNVIVSLIIGREKSIAALDAAMQSKDSRIVLATQKDPEENDPAGKDLFPMGVICNIIQVIKLPDGTVKILAEGMMRAKMLSIIADGSYILADINPIHQESDIEQVEQEALIRAVKDQFNLYAEQNRRVNPEVTKIIAQSLDPAKTVDFCSYNLPIPTLDKQELLNETSLKKRFELILEILNKEVTIMDFEREISNKIRNQMEKSHREYYLKEKLKAIEKELGTEADDPKEEIYKLEQQIKKTKLSKEALEKATSELKKLKMMNPLSAEASVVRNYIETLIELPWGKQVKTTADVKKAETILNKDHFGLEKPKERILEYIAVYNRTKKIKGSIICLFGPPGVGKTSLAKSIADSLNRPFGKIALGGVRDEAEIRGHRRTYIGSMPGKIISTIKKLKVNNPVILLDEIDKMGMDYRGDPASALLEVLDPNQNSHFVDHYLEVEFDLSDVMFIATSNSYNLPRPLLDRLEIIQVSSYTEEEKLQIALNHLMPKIVKEHGLASNEITIKTDAIKDIIRFYTREAGVRNLERQLSNLARKAVKNLSVDKKLKNVTITVDNLKDFAGPKKFISSEAEKISLIGVTNGLAYTEVGGELLTIEAVLVPGKGSIKITGKLGEVMQESAQAALSYVKSKGLELGIIPPKFAKHDLHIHVPEGATPKDGPSAGIALVTTIVSVMTNIPVDNSVAMTGEITLRGRVLPIGGLKEKLVAAQRAGMKKVLIPHDNIKDLEEIPENVKNSLTIIPVENVDEVLKHALTEKTNPTTWDEVEYLRSQKELLSSETEDYLTH